MNCFPSSVCLKMPQILRATVIKIPSTEAQLQKFQFLPKRNHSYKRLKKYIKLKKSKELVVCFSVLWETKAHNKTLK